MGKPNYRVVISFDRERNLHTARSPELEHLSGEGTTRAEAIGRLEEEIDAQLANMLSLGTTPPRAIDEAEHSGEVKCKVSRSLHRELVYLARSEGVEVDQLVSELLSAALTSRQGARGGGRSRAAAIDTSDDIGNRIDSGHGPRRGFGRGNGAQILDDRANFIEYVRGLENGNGNHGGRHQGHAGGGGGHGGHRDPNANRGGGGGGRRGRGRGPGGHPGQHQGHQGHGGHRDGNRMQGGPRGPQGPQSGQPMGQPSAPQNRPPAPQGGSSDPDSHES